jgi:S-formylglutathione hydrolase FrmB
VLAVALTLGASLAPVRAGAELRTGSFQAPSLGREVGYVVDLPESYGQGGDRRYPVVYVMHGLFEGPSFWEQRGLSGALARLRAEGGLPDLIAVTVDGGNSFYVNGPQGNYEDLLAVDLPAHMEQAWRAAPGRARRAVLGISMGGYGALRLALKRPDAFGAVATHSAMLLERLPTAEGGAGRGQMAAFKRVFGDPIDEARWVEADPLAWAAKVEARAVPALRFDCGSEDRYGLANGNRRLHEALEARGIAHEFELAPGDHGYPYVLSMIDRSLRFLARGLGEKEAPRPSPSPVRKR